MKTGERVGPYQILEKLGAGGMGEVFRARDIPLGRDVAIKVLPESFARDPDRVARFRREAQALAALNDPRIAQIYQLEETHHAAALVMEFVDGRTLADLIGDRGVARGLALDDALGLAAQIAAGLEVAHEHGIIHRDLKPANIKVTSDGRVKLLDFGLAKALGAEAASGDQAHSPTLTARATEAGMLLGTAAYMSPEQARGRAVDKRTDIWAFGTVLFEMLTGRRLFDGDTVSDTIAAVLRSDVDLARVPDETPLHVRTLLKRCLERDPSRRLRDIGEARLALDTSHPPVSTSGLSREISPGAPGASAIADRSQDQMPSSPTARVWKVATALLAASSVVLGAFAYRSWTRQPPELSDAGLELAIVAPTDARFEIGGNSGNVILSPDGTRIAFVASKGGPRAIWVRALAADDARPLPGTEGAFYPFWSPDGRRIGFFTTGRLMAVDVGGGLPEMIAEVATAGRGGAWGTDGTIVFAGSANAPLSRVSATGGPVTQVTRLEPERGENVHYWPVWLPDGERILYYVRSATRPEHNGIYVTRIDGSSAPTRVVASLSSGILAPHPQTGELFLLWVRDGDLLAQAFDVNASTLVGEVSVIARDVRVEDSHRLAFISASNNGLLAWATERAATTVFALYGRDGRRLRSLNVPPGGSFTQPAFSPDGKRLLFTRIDKGSGDIHVHDLETGTTQPVTLAPEFDELGAWSADSRSILHLGYRPEGYTTFRVPLDSVTQPVALHRGESTTGRPLLTSDGRFLICTVSVSGGRNIVAVPLGDSSTPVTLATGAIAGAISGDGRWLIMATLRGGRATEGIARLYTGDDGPRVGGLVPVPGVIAVRRDAREVYVQTPNREIQAIPVITSEHSAVVGTAQTILNVPDALAVTVNGDGTQFLVLEQPYAAAQTLRVLTRWHERLTR